MAFAILSKPEDGKDKTQPNQDTGKPKGGGSDVKEAKNAGTGKPVGEM